MTVPLHGCQEVSLPRPRTNRTWAGVNCYMASDAESSTKTSATSRVKTNHLMAVSFPGLRHAKRKLGPKKDYRATKGYCIPSESSISSLHRCIENVYAKDLMLISVGILFHEALSSRLFHVKQCLCRRRASALPKKKDMEVILPL